MYEHFSSFVCNEEFIQHFYDEKTCISYFEGSLYLTRRSVLNKALTVEPNEITQLYSKLF